MMRWLNRFRGVAAQVTCVSAVPLALVAAMALRPAAQGDMFDPAGVDMGRSAAMDDPEHVARCSACRLSPAAKAGLPASRRPKPVPPRAPLRSPSP